MNEILKKRTGGQILVSQLQQQGVKHVFCVPGESYLAVLDALYDSSIAITICRQEGGASMMADAQGKLTGRPGVCMVTRGPGVANALAGIHIAKQDSTPLIVFVGQIETGMRERDAFQEVDYKAVFSSQTKWTVEIDDPARIPELVGRAFHMAMSGRPGPVVIALPEDMLRQTAVVADGGFIEPVAIAPPLELIQQTKNLLNTARNPIAILGGGQWQEQEIRDFADLATHYKLPVAVQFRRQSAFPNTHPNYAGDVGLGVNPQLLQRIQQADVVLLLGGRMAEVPSQSYTLFNIPTPKQTLIHVHSDVQELNRVYQAQVPVNATTSQFIKSLKQLSTIDSEQANKEQSQFTENAELATARAQQVQAAHDEYLRWSDPSRISVPGALKVSDVMCYIEKHVADDAIMTNGAGNYATWLHRFHRYLKPNTQLAPTSGSMGYGLPAAVAAKKLYPERQVICFAGDGCFLMHGQEFATAVQYDLPIIVLIFDNSMYGTIRMHQEVNYPGRISGTTLKNPDFAAYAKAFGGYGECVQSSQEFGAAFERAVASGKPAILHCLVDPEAITPSKTLSQIRNKQ